MMHAQVTFLREPPLAKLRIELRSSSRGSALRTNLDDKERLLAESAPGTIDFSVVGERIGGSGISGITCWGLLTAPPAPAASKRLLLTGIDSGRDDDDVRLDSVPIVKLSLASSVAFTFRRENNQHSDKRN